MKDIILNLVQTNAGWLARQVIKWAAVAAACAATWLHAKGFSETDAALISAVVTSVILGCVELALSFIARKYKVAGDVKMNIEQLRKGAQAVVLLLVCTMLASCAALTAFVASPQGQASLVTAETLGKQLAHATEARVLEQIISKGTAQITALKAVDDTNADLGKQIVKQSEITGLQGVIDAAQNQYVGLTGSRFVVPKNPVAVSVQPNLN
jgi:repressor of nif and glnA expression